jgi:2-polyprenyl-3-methyl-5-hydroxy-6-metoxy-1,4-benzoquinol methylase
MATANAVFTNIHAQGSRSQIDRAERGMNRYWAHRSESYSEMNQLQFGSDRRDAWERAIFDGIDESRKLRILDIGTGPGFFAIISALRGHEVVAVDMNAEMLQKAQKNAAEAGANVLFMQVGHVLPFKAESFDLIISRDVTWTLTEPEEQLRAWAGLLRPGGTMRYFDAEWYGYLKDAQSMAAWTVQKQKILAEGGSFYTRASELEKIAVGLPMTYKSRPVWDTLFWQKEQYHCTVRQNINAEVYSRKEQIQYQNYSVFSVTVWREVK